MKKLALILLAVAFWGGTCFAEPGYAEPETETEGAAKEAKEESGFCPKTKIAGKVHDCLICHTSPSFKLKESRQDEGLDVPGYGTRLLFDDGKPVAGYLMYEAIDAENVERFLEYLDTKGIRRLVLEIYSPGGSMFKAWRTVGVLDLWKAKGFTIETRVHGYAASAGFMVFCAGSRGNRFVSPHAELMWHELITFKIFDISSPSDKEDEAKILRHFQDSSNTWLQSVSRLTKKEIDELIRKKEFWMHGTQAVEYGFADGLLANGE